MSTNINNLEDIKDINLKLIPLSAVIGSAIIGVGLSFLFNLFNIAIGFTTFKLDPTTITALTFIGYIWLLSGGTIIMLIMGWLAGRLGYSANQADSMGILHGLLSWCIALLIIITFSLQMSSFISYYSIVPAYSSTQIHQKIIPTASNVIDINNNDVNNLNATTLNSQPSKNTQPIINIIGLTAFEIFIIFFTGALASSIGGYYGHRSGEQINTLG